MPNVYNLFLSLSVGTASSEAMRYASVLAPNIFFFFFGAKRDSGELAVFLHKSFIHMPHLCGIFILLGIQVLLLIQWLAALLNL
jgi:hypothetical protein